MTLLWSLVAGSVYFYAFLSLLFALPVPASISRFYVGGLRKLFANYYVRLGSQIFSAMILLLLADAMREYSKISNDLQDPTYNLDKQLELKTRLFRSQRNMYLCFFNIFMTVILPTLITAKDNQLKSDLNKNMIEKQAKGNEQLFQTVLKENEDLKKQIKETGGVDVNEFKKQINDLKRENAHLRQEMDKISQKSNTEKKDD